MTQLYKNIKLRRIALNMTQAELAEALGYADKSMIAKIEKGLVDLPQSKILSFATVLKTSPLALTGWDIDAEPSTTANTNNYFPFQIHDAAMQPRIQKGDTVIVQPQDDANSGEFIIAEIYNRDLTCRRLKKYADGIMLLSNNPDYDPLIFSNQEIAKNDIKILGRVIELRAKL